MNWSRLVIVAALCVGGCGAPTPPPIEVGALVRTQGAVAVHRDLAARARSHPRDVPTRLALAAVAEVLGRPGEAIEALVAVERFGGPFGPRWHDADRARLARLLLRRGRARLARGSTRALDDLRRARQLGAAVSAVDLRAARAALALSQLRHVDDEQRAKGRTTLASLYGAQRGLGDSRSHAANRSTMESSMRGESSWRGARSDAAPVDRAAFGVWAWQHGARREAYDQLTAWHAATTSPRDERYEASYRRAVRWWSLESTALSPDARAAVAAGDASAPEAADVDAPAVVYVDGDTPAAAYVGGDARADAAAHFARARMVAIVARILDASREVSPKHIAAAGVPELAELVEIGRAFRRSPAAAAYFSGELVARSIDASVAHATVGALFDALGDPARARTAWDAAASAEVEPGFAAGYAEACARAGDGDAALIAATHAAAAWGDPAVVWNWVARVLLDSDRVVDALTAGRAAIDLAGPEHLPEALDIATEASRRVGRVAQAEALAARRASLPSPMVRSEATAAREELIGGATPSAIDRAWLATRKDQREVDLRADLLAALPADDPRRGFLIAELVTLAGDSDHLRGLRAAFALKSR